MQAKLREMKAEKEALDKKLGKEQQTLAIARTAADSEARLLQSANNDVAAAQARGKAAVTAQKQVLTQLEQDEQKKERAAQRAGRKVDADRLTETKYKEEIARKKEVLKQKALDLEDLTRQERKAKDVVQDAEKKTSEIRNTIADVKTKADSSAHKVESHKTDLNDLQKAAVKMKADTEVKLAYQSQDSTRRSEEGEC